MNGFLVIDKPPGISSRDAVNAVQNRLPRKTKIGHTGTLDPLATGVLVVCIGAATRLADYIQAMPKSYTSRFRLGAGSTTDDADGTITVSPQVEPVSREEVVAALASFVGRIDQLPPAFSALKLDGQRAHHLARQGRDVPLAPRRVRIDAIRLVRYEWPFLDVEIDCGKGTYIRSIARDLGTKLGVGGLVQTLRRMRIGPFKADQGIGIEAPLDELQRKLLLPAAAVTHLPAVRIDAEQERRLRTGQTIRIAADAAEGSAVAIFGDANRLIGIGEVKQGIQPRIVLTSA